MEEWREEKGQLGESGCSLTLRRGGHRPAEAAAASRMSAASMRPPSSSRKRPGPAAPAPGLAYVSAGPNVRWDRA